jgi:divalent metal cation (Fe/Co/Zn/Cd) transporter
LLIAKLIVTLTSSSLSVLASLVDSILDFLSTVIIYSVSRIIQSKDWKSQYDFPVGKARLEPIGVLVFSVIMIVSFIQVGVEAVQRLFKSGKTQEVVVLSIPGIMIMISTGLVAAFETDGSCGKTWVLVMVEVGEKFRCTGVGSRCNERCYFQVPPSLS